MVDEVAEEICLICVDAGTTNTRVWLTHGDRIIAHAQTLVGVRDTARDGSSERLRNALRELIHQVRQAQDDTRNDGFTQSPECVIAAGMITSPLGLAEVPHVAAPAGSNDLAAATQKHSFPEITDLPILLIPGVRSGPRRCDQETVGKADVMRGEETLVVGLNTLGLLAPRSTLLNLGSHWKLIKLDEAARIASSVTSMTGELIHTAQTQTILASSVPQARPAALDQPWLEAGMREQRRSGLARALFCVRLLEQGSDSSAEQRLSFLIGAFLASDIDAMLSCGLLSSESPVVITGGGVIAEAWRNALAHLSVQAITLGDSDVERALLAGCRKIFPAIAR
ncbi:MAG: 2-dehydro-3-deoxygalactonokinase [Blastocatellales bacterium]